MLPAIDPVSTVILPQSAGQEAMTTVQAVKRNDPDQSGNVFTWRLRSRTEDGVLATARAGHLAAHSALCSILWRPASIIESHYKGLSPTVKPIAISRSTPTALAFRTFQER
jgi:hypothetical protein